MTGYSELLATTPQPEAASDLPDKGRRQLEYDSDGGTLVTGWKPVGTIHEDDKAIFADWDLDPARWRIVNLRRSRWEQKPGVELESAKVTFAARSDTDVMLDTAEFVKAVKAYRRKPKAMTEPGRAALVVVMADPQWGKTGSGGNSQDLANRILSKRDALADHIRTLRSFMQIDEAVFLDPGDGIENFENVAAQAQTNDLDLTAQVEHHIWGTHLFLEYLAREFPRVQSAGCGSNHCRVRKNREAVGKPTDDWGVFVQRQIRAAYKLNPDAFGHVEFRLPTEWSETVALDVVGKRIGLAHGHQASEDKIPDWFAMQSHGRQPVADADILVTGHYHSYRAQDVGNGQRWYQAPTLDNGSDWYTHKTGKVSKPGMLTFVVTADGPDWERIL